MDRISIDFVAGSHGHFLEYMCNKFIAQQSIDFSPFSSSGASHAGDLNKEYLNNRTFTAFHFSEFQLPLTKKIIRITFSGSDLLVLSSVSLLRAGDHNISNNELEIDTFNKLNNDHYKDLIVQINQAYPDTNLSESNTNCARYILREYFKFGFKDPAGHGLMKKLNQFVYASEHTVFDFPFSSLYNQTSFVKLFSELAVWCGIDIVDYTDIILLWKEFYSKQIYKDHKHKCDNIISAVELNNYINIPKLTLFQESYINAELEKKYNIEMPFMQDEYFSSTEEIVTYINNYVQN